MPLLDRLGLCGGCSCLACPGSFTETATSLHITSPDVVQRLTSDAQVIQSTRKLLCSAFAYKAHLNRMLQSVEAAISARFTVLLLVLGGVRYYPPADYTHRLSLLHLFPCLILNDDAPLLLYAERALPRTISPPSRRPVRRRLHPANYCTPLA